MFWPVKLGVFYERKYMAVRLVLFSKGITKQMFDCSYHFIFLKPFAEGFIFCPPLDSSTGGQSIRDSLWPWFGTLEFSGFQALPLQA